MDIVIRTDSSLDIGTGHVMRCLTLAGAFKEKGARCQFICREHPGNLIEVIRSQGYKVDVLPVREPKDATRKICAGTRLPHARWLGATQEEDASRCAAILADVKPEWLIVDHYALDACWEAAVQPFYQKLMVIDDLADRSHLCNLLLDQNLGRRKSDYSDLLPSDCKVFTGPKYALLRPEFAMLRPYSLARRKIPQLKHLLILMGGIDKDNATSEVLEVLKGSDLPADCCISVVIGSTAPWRDFVHEKAASMPWPTEVRVNVLQMAKLMAEADLAIGAAGTTALERCCLGLPTLAVVLAANQLEGAQALRAAGAVELVDNCQNISVQLREKLARMLKPERLAEMQRACSTITDGYGAVKLGEELAYARC